MNSPPPALDCAQVIKFAFVDETVTFEQRQTLNVGGEWLGQVPHLAICQALGETEYIVFHCSREWEVLGVAAGYGTIQDAKQKTERSYHGITAKWMASGYSRDEAVKYVEAQFRDQVCSFCGRNPSQFEAIAGNSVRICNRCVDGFYEDMHSASD